MANDKRIAQFDNGQIRAGPTIQELVDSWAAFSKEIFLVENHITKDRVIGTMGECFNKHLEWRRNGHRVTVTKLDHEAAKVLYGKT